MTGKEYFEMLKKRRSYHDFSEMTGSITKNELEKIEEFLKSVKPLDDSIAVRTEIVKKEETTLKVGEYAILFYSEVKEGWLENIGYIGEQVDLFVESEGIGSCWYGMAKPVETQKDGLSFAILIAIGKVHAETLRKGEDEFKRKPLCEVWQGEKYKQIGDIARFAPSAVNSQLWKMVEDGDTLTLIRKREKVGVIPVEKIEYFNKVDMGIFMFFLEVAIEHFGMEFERELVYKKLSEEEVETAKYKIIR